MNVLNGVTSISYANSEYTSALVLSQYLTAMQTLQTLLNKGTSSSSSSSSLSISDYNTFRDAVQSLLNLSQNGATTSLDPSNFLNLTLAQNVNLVLSSVEAAGIPLPPPAANAPNGINLLQNWQGLSGFVTDILHTALNIDAKSMSYTLQSMLELEYVKQGNDMISTNLVNLEQALQSTQNILNTLQTIQGISNQIKAPTPSAFNTSNINFGSDNTGVLEQVYKTAASAQFAQLYPTAAPTSTAPQDLLSAKNALMQQIPILDRLTPAQSSNGMMLPAHEIANTLANFVYKVALDISSAFKTALNGVDPTTLDAATLKQKQLTAASNWILDGQGVKLGNTGSSTAGVIQNNITQAINSAQSLNDTEKENVQNYLFIFQQFYNSASTVLQKITQIVEKFAHGIGQ